ncbi:MAG: PilZ domain-containing protein [Qipengyuania sp.]
MERRERERKETDIGLICRVPASPHKAQIRDLSLAGCRARIIGAHVEPGYSISFELPGVRPFSGVVVWVRSDVVGIRFAPALKPVQAIALGLDDPRPQPVEVSVDPVPHSGGVLHHWFHSLLAKFA